MIFIGVSTTHRVERSDTSRRSISNRRLRTCSFGGPATRYPFCKARRGSIHKRLHSRVSIDRSSLGLVLKQDAEHVAIAHVGLKRRWSIGLPERCCQALNIEVCRRSRRDLMLLPTTSDRRTESRPGHNVSTSAIRRQYQYRSEWKVGRKRIRRHPGYRRSGQECWRGCQSECSHWHGSRCVLRRDRCM